jgi:hypothetical protein
METPMADSPALSFEAVAYKFRKRWVVITSLPGEYSIGYLNGPSDATEIWETLAELMASQARAAATKSAAGYRRKR